MRRIGQYIVIVMACLAASAGNTAAEGASGTVGVSPGRPDIDILVIQSRLYKVQQTLSGFVTQTDAGLALLTEYGVYKLHGISLEERIGEEVSVTGFIRDDDERKSIYVIKIGKKE